MNTLRTERTFAAYFFLNIVTLGIYGIVQVAHMSDEINLIASKHDGKSTMNFLWIVLLFGWLTLGIAAIVWYHRISNRIGDELRRRGERTDFSADTWWLWYFLGSAIAIGPYVYVYKRIQAMNRLNELYNKEVER